MGRSEEGQAYKGKVVTRLDLDSDKLHALARLGNHSIDSLRFGHIQNIDNLLCNKKNKRKWGKEMEQVTTTGCANSRFPSPPFQISFSSRSLIEYSIDVHSTQQQRSAHLHARPVQRTSTPQETPRQSSDKVSCAGPVRLLATSSLPVCYTKRSASATTLADGRTVLLFVLDTTAFVG